MKHLSAYLTLPILLLLLLLLAATGCSREEMAPENELPAGTFRIETRVAGTNELLPNTTNYMCLVYSGEFIDEGALNLDGTLPSYILGNGVSLGSDKHSVFLSAIIGSDTLKIENIAANNNYSALKFSLVPTKEETDKVKNVPYLLYDKQKRTSKDSYTLLLRSPMAMLHFSIDGIGVSLCESIELQVEGVPTTFTPSKDVTDGEPYGDPATLIVPGSIDKYAWKATTPTFPTSAGTKCTFVCKMKEGSTEERKFTFDLPETKAGKTYNYQFNFEHEISLSTVSVKEWTLADSFEGHADPE